MRIGIITGEYPPLEGGVGDFTRELSRTLHAHGHEIHILTGGERATTPTREDDLHIYRQIASWDWGSYPKITRWARQIAPDVLNIQYQAAAYQMRATINLYPRWQRRRLPAPVVVTYHDLLPPYLFPKAGPLRQWAVWQLASHADGVITTNGPDYTRLITALEQDKRPPTRLIPIGSNIAPKIPTNYDRDAWRARYGIAPDALLIGFFGFLNRSKGVEALLDALAQLQNAGLPAHVLFIGGRTGSSDPTNAAYAAEIEARAEALGITARVHHTGFITPTEVSASLLASDICALPYRDGASLRRGTLHACLAHGRPIITTTPQSAVDELQHGKNVHLIPPEDATALAEAIRTLWEAPEMREELGKGAAALAQEFSWERIAARTAEFFRSLKRVA